MLTLAELVAQESELARLPQPLANSAFMTETHVNIVACSLQSVL